MCKCEFVPKTFVISHNQCVAQLLSREKSKVLAWPARRPALILTLNAIIGSYLGGNVDWLGPGTHIQV